MRDVFNPPLSVLETSKLSASDVDYLDRVRGLTGRLGRRSGDNQLGDALADLEASAAIDSDILPLSRRRSVRLVKRLVTSLVGWYLRYLAQQTTVLGQATARLGAALVERAERLEDRTGHLQSEVDALRQRVEVLERNGRGGAHVEPPGS
jgi:hypothetical protein